MNLEQIAKNLNCDNIFLFLNLLGVEYAGYEKYYSIYDIDKKDYKKLLDLIVEYEISCHKYSEITDTDSIWFNSEPILGNISFNICYKILEKYNLFIEHNKLIKNE
jgi:hypothetical protein